jgi:hypothetical protein
LSRREIRGGKLFAHTVVGRAGRIRREKVRQRILGLGVLEEFLTNGRIPLKIGSQLARRFFRDESGFLKPSCFE